MKRRSDQQGPARSGGEEALVRALASQQRGRGSRVFDVEPLRPAIRSRRSTTLCRAAPGLTNDDGYRRFAESRRSAIAYLDGREVPRFKRPLSSRSARSYFHVELKATTSCDGGTARRAFRVSWKAQMLSQ